MFAIHYPVAGLFMANQGTEFVFMVMKRVFNNFRTIMELLYKREVMTLSI